MSATLAAPAVTRPSGTGPDPGPSGAGPTGPARHRATARTHGAAAALTLLHAETGPGVLPAGPGGHVLLPRETAAACDRYGTPDGPRPRRAAGETELARIPSGAGELVALRVPGAGPGPDGAWETGVAWIRLGLAEHLVARAAEHLRGRAVQGTVTLNLPLVRAMLADAACGLAEARALLEDDPATALPRVHPCLDETGRTCLHLFGATGFLATGPGADVRVSELLADTYAPNAGGRP
jgi:alkylation response protein AidB-like acyl-CoA dehydrogenase